jgi:hypothetical protein
LLVFLPLCFLPIFDDPLTASRYSCKEHVSCRCQQLAVELWDRLRYTLPC